MKEIVREYGTMAVAILGTYGIVKIMEYYMLGQNGIVEILFKIFISPDEQDNFCMISNSTKP